MQVKEAKEKAKYGGFTFVEKNCPKCGHPFSIEKCYYCGLPVYEEKAVKWDESDYENCTTYYAHSLCASSRGKLESSKDPSGCFIASTVCDTSAQELLVLRSFRDYYLEQNRLGRLFMKGYMQLSPPAARIISKSPVLRLLVRSLFVKPIAMAVERLLGRGNLLSVKQPKLKIWRFTK